MAEHPVHCGLVEDVGAVVRAVLGQVQVEREVRLGAEADADEHRTPAPVLRRHLGDQVGERDFVRQRFLARRAHALDDFGEAGRATEIHPQRHQGTDPEQDVRGARVTGQQHGERGQQGQLVGRGQRPGQPGADGLAGVRPVDRQREFLRRRGEPVTPEFQLRHLLHSVTVAHR